jgi:ABC-type sugar transport system ATPase subunit
VRKVLTLKLVRITKKFPRFTLGPIDLKIENNKILVIIGPTGSGKSSILNLIAGILKPDSGSILMDGLDITNLPVHLRRIGFTFQNPSLFPHLTAKRTKKENDLQIRKLLEDLGISHISYRNTEGLSGGEMQKFHWQECLSQTRRSC